MLPGENSLTKSPDDVRHWARVYRQLVDFKERVLGETYESMKKLDMDAVTEVARTDATVLEAELARLKRRLEFWTQRSLALQGSQAPEELLKTGGSKSRNPV